MPVKLAAPPPELDAGPVDSSSVRGSRGAVKGGRVIAIQYEPRQENQPVGPGLARS